MAVRNFWVDTLVDGRKTPLRGGPQGRQGGVSVRVWQRDKGGASTALTVDGFVGANGNLILDVRDGDGNSVLYHVTER